MGPSKQVMCSGPTITPCVCVTASCCDLSLPTELRPLALAARTTLRLHAHFERLRVVGPSLVARAPTHTLHAAVEPVGQVEALPIIPWVRVGTARVGAVLSREPTPVGEHDSLRGVGGNEPPQDPFRSRRVLGMATAESRRLHGILSRWRMQQGRLVVQMHPKLQHRGKWRQRCTIESPPAAISSHQWPKGNHLRLGGAIAEHVEGMQVDELLAGVFAVATGGQWPRPILGRRSEDVGSDHGKSTAFMAYEGHRGVDHLVEVEKVDG